MLAHELDELLLVARIGLDGDDAFGLADGLRHGGRAVQIVVGDHHLLAPVALSGEPGDGLADCAGTKEEDAHEVCSAACSDVFDGFRRRHTSAQQDLGADAALCCAVRRQR